MQVIKAGEGTYLHYQTQPCSTCHPCILTASAVNANDAGAASTAGTAKPGLDWTCLCVCIDGGGSGGGSGDGAGTGWWW